MNDPLARGATSADPTPAPPSPTLRLGRARSLHAPPGDPSATPLEVPPHHLVTHGVIVGMTGSGKTGASIVLLEEVLRARVPVLVLDVKGDLPNLFLAFPSLSPAEFGPWVDVEAAARRGKTAEDAASETATAWAQGLASWGLGAKDVAELARSIAPRIITPGAGPGEPLHVLSSLSTRSPLWDEDEALARESLGATLSLLLRLVQRDPDPRSREHAVLATLAERRLRAGQAASLELLLQDLANPPIATIGAMSLADFFPPKDQRALAQELNALLASPSFATWLRGAPLDVGGWLRPQADGRTPAVIVSVAHLDDEERMLVLGLLLEEVLAWVRGLSGTSELRALVVFDEVFGFLPPHPHNPPTKRPLLALLKQARAFGVGVVVATQNPMDLDYKALSNAGVWLVGRLQTDADRERVVEGLTGSDAGPGAAAGLDAATLTATLRGLPPRTFFLRDVHARPQTALLETRWSMSWLRGPMTRRELGRLARTLAPQAPAAPPPAPAQHAQPPAPAQHAQPPPAAAPPPIAPTVPDGFLALFAPAAVGASARPPHVLVTLHVHVAQPKLAIDVRRICAAAAPLATDGRADLARAREVDRAALTPQSPPGARIEPLPQPFFKKSIAQAAVRAIRDHVARAIDLQVDVHAELGLARTDMETHEAFGARCIAEARRRAELDKQALAAESAPRLAKLQDRLRAAQSELTSARAASSSAPNAIGAALVGIAFGASGRRDMDRKRKKTEDRLEKAERAITTAEGALREALAERDAELVAIDARATTAASAIEVRRVTPKKDEVEVTEVAIVW